MKAITLGLILFALSSFAGQAQEILGDYPVCKSPQAVQNFDQAQRFNDFKKMEDLIAKGECLFVQPETRGKVLDPTVYPKVMVFVPYKNPITGWTRQENLK